MKTVSQKSTINANQTSTSNKVSLLKKGKTPSSLQAKRYKKSKEKWKSKASKRALENHENKKRIAEIQASRELHKEKNKKILRELDKLKQQYEGEVLRRNERQAQELLSKKIDLEAQAQLEQAIEGLKEIDQRIEVFSHLQIDVEDHFTHLNSYIDEYYFEKLSDPESAFVIEMAEKIRIEIVWLQEQLTTTDIELAVLMEKSKSPYQTVSGGLLNLYKQAMHLVHKRLQQVKLVQENFKRRLKLGCARFENKKNRQGAFKGNKNAKNHAFSAALIKYALMFVIVCAVSIRAAAKIIKVNAIFSDMPTPSYTTIGEWGKKIGFYLYHLPKNQKIQRIWIVDFSIQFGPDKLMLVLGLNKEKINDLKIKNKKDQLKISFQEIEILHMCIVKTTAYESTLRELEKTAEKCGLPLFILSDEGSDLAKATRMFIENHQGIQHLHDISHKLSNLLKAELENDPKWNEFCQIVTRIKQQLKLSNIAEICPPKFRQKVRYINVRDPIQWAMLILDLKNECFDLNQQKNFVTLVKEPLEKLRKEIMKWHAYSNFITIVETEIKHHGLTKGHKSTHQTLSDYIKDQIKPRNLKFYNQILKFVNAQEAKLAQNQTVIGSTDLIESLFGKWKSMSHEDSMAGITDLIFLLPLLTVKLTDALVIKALEETPIHKINDWKEKNLGKTIYSKRHEILHSKKRSTAPQNQVGEDRKSRELSCGNCKRVA